MKEKTENELKEEKDSESDIHVMRYKMLAYNDNFLQLTNIIKTI